MKPHSIVCNRCRLVCAKFYLNRCRFTVVIAKCLGGSLFGTQCTSAKRKGRFRVYSHPLV